MMLSSRQVGRVVERAMRGALRSYTTDDAFLAQLAGRLSTNPALVRLVAEAIVQHRDIGERAALALEVEMRRAGHLAETIVEHAPPVPEVELAPVVTPAPPLAQPAQARKAVPAAALAPVVLPPGIVAPDPSDPVQQPDFAEARQMLRRGAGAAMIAEELGWPLAFPQEWCAAERPRR